MTDIALLGIKVDSSLVKKAEADLDAMALAGARAQDAAQDLGAATAGPMARGFSAAGGQGRMLAQQLSQVAQQSVATGNVMQAVAIQAADIGLAFGAVGAVVGTVATIALPALVAALSGTTTESLAAAEATQRLVDAQNALADAARSTQTEIDKLRFGVDEEYQVELLREQVRLRDEYNVKVAELNRYLLTTTDNLDRQQMVTRDLRGEIEQIAGAYQKNAAALAQQADRAATLAVMEGVRVQRANEIAAKQGEAARQSKIVEDALRDAGVHASIIASLDFSNIADAAAFAGGIATAMRSAVAYASQLSATGQSSGPDAARTMVQFGGPIKLSPSGAGLPFVPAVGGGGKGGGGGGGSDTYTPRLEALVQELKTAREIEDEWYQENLAILNDRRAQEILGEQAHKDALVALELEYQSRIAEIEAEARARKIADAAGLFGTLADIASAGGQKSAKAVATFQAIEGTINAYGAAIKALNTPGITLAGRFAAYGSVLAAGLKGVQAIRSAGGIAGGVGVAAQGAVAGAAGGSVEWIVRGLSRTGRYSGAEIEEIFEGIMGEARRRNMPVPMISFME